VTYIKHVLLINNRYNTIFLYSNQRVYYFVDPKIMEKTHLTRQKIQNAIQDVSWSKYR